MVNSNDIHVCGPFGVCRTGSDEKCYCLPGFRPVSSRSWDLGAWNQGCVRRTDISCVDSNIHNVQQENHAFLKIANIKVSGNPIQLNAQSTEECKSICLNNCTCTAYAYQRECIVWNSELWDLKQLSDGNIDGIDIYVRLAASDLQGQDNENKIHHARPMLIAVLGSIFVTLCVFGAVVWTFQKRNANQKAFSSDDPLILYSYSLLQNCTKNFSDKLGQGSFGSVYKGSLPNSQLIAVKKLQGMRQGEKQFQTEVRALGQIHHRNLVRLKGFCLRGAERLLVYELIAKGSLDSHLFNDVKVLDWYTRFHVILGIAKGLHYLHEECHECIIHCDIKPENILVDEDFSPKVADFGLAKLMDRNFSRALTTVRGTIGYLAPEWIAGKRNTELMESGTIKYFPVWAADKIRNGDISEVFDHRMNDTDVQELDRACKVACWCIQDNEAHRPTMQQIVHILQGTRDVGLPPVPAFLQHLVEEYDPGSYSSNV
ncbi:G-type lectin S-receptor-like serine/threonine-protein kinase At2g19130 [Oryza brachyantha]|uniref:G-type lectin S-receptor-like serine/threonine-protein kinase At2g19130 n=1 Tax=Oryza brachyantha TaxID=4533 RepID=UPI001ADA2BCF|nr:G-type lectin S-receptor-like serine/threonine-protein kinase At2g19130 [Oryza brachyantha]